jgi:N-methylhydantoinase A
VRTVGAGGGSIASLNAAGMLTVGPHSAGSEPGPICYGRGGTDVTITDANLVLGRLDPGKLLAVQNPVTVAHVRGLVEAKLAKPLGISIEAAASAVLTLGNMHMAGAIRMVSLSRGHDPRDFALFAFGGAGPLHAVALARELGLAEVLVPARPGLTNALGCLVADLRQDFVQTLNLGLDQADMGHVALVLDAQKAQGLAINADEQDEIVETVVLHGADMQFRGQTHLIRVALPGSDVSREALQALFEAAYFKRFQVQLPEIRAVLVNLVTSVIGKRRALPLASLIDPAGRKASAGQAVVGQRPLFADGVWHDAKVYQREMLPIGALVPGPAVIQQVDATTIIEPGWMVKVDGIGNLRIVAGVA